MTNSSPVISNGTVTMMTVGGSAGSSGGYSVSTSLPSTGGKYYGTGYPTSYPGSYPYPSTTGYTCPNCGTYVYYGNYHSCYPKVIPTVIYQPVYIPQAPTDLTPLLEKLDDLTKEVKKLRKSLQNDE